MEDVLRPTNIIYEYIIPVTVSVESKLHTDSSIEFHIPHHDCDVLLTALISDIYDYYIIILLVIPPNQYYDMNRPLD